MGGDRAVRRAGHRERRLWLAGQPRKAGPFAQLSLVAATRRPPGEAEG